MANCADPLVDYLRQLEAKGDTHVRVDDDARSILREFYLRARKGGPAPVAAQQKTTSPATGEPAVEPGQAPVEKTATPEVALTLSGGSAREKLDNLKRQAEKWQPVRDLGTLRKTMVFSTGNPNADVMLVGEAPGYDEERLHEPFVGKAGKKLDGILRAMGIERKDAYLTNIVKFRPAMANQTTNNRKPTAEETAACMPFILAEVKIVQPKVIVALGGTAAQALLESHLAVARMRGSFHQYQGTPLRVTYHPSYILHNEATSEKRKLWEDMLEVMKLLDMPISAKQQAYFLPQ